MTECDCLNYCGDDPDIKSGKVNPCDFHIKRDDKRKLDLAEAEDRRQAAEKMANALRDIYNQLGHMEEVETIYETVDKYVDIYTN